MKKRDNKSAVQSWLKFGCLIDDHDQMQVRSQITFDTDVQNFT